MSQRFLPFCFSLKTFPTVRAHFEATELRRTRFAGSSVTVTVDPNTHIREINPWS